VLRRCVTSAFMNAAKCDVQGIVSSGDGSSGAIRNFSKLLDSADA